MLRMKFVLKRMGSNRVEQAKLMPPTREREDRIESAYAAVEGGFHASKLPNRATRATKRK